MISVLKIKLNHSWELWRNWKVSLMLLQRSWWAGFNGIYLVRFGFRMWEILIFKWFLPLEIQINSKKPGFGTKIATSNNKGIKKNKNKIENTLRASKMHRIFFVGAKRSTKKCWKHQVRCQNDTPRTSRSTYRMSRGAKASKIFYIFYTLSNHEVKPWGQTMGP
jgi:hypothetical protein